MSPLDKTYEQDYEDLHRGLTAEPIHNPDSTRRGDRRARSSPLMPKDRAKDPLRLLVQALLAQAEEELGRRRAERSRRRRAPQPGATTPKRETP